MADPRRIQFQPVNSDHERHYIIRLNGQSIGQVWRTFGWRDRYTRWGTISKSKPHYVAQWWRCTGTLEEFDTRREAVEFMVREWIRRQPDEQDARMEEAAFAAEKEDDWSASNG